MGTDQPRQHRATLGRNIRSLRLSRRLTLRQLADLVAVSQATLSAIETGKTGISAARIAQLAEALDVPVQVVFTGADLPSLEPTAATAPRPGTASGEAWRTFGPLVLDPALTAALSSFVDLGYHGASVRTIAERANLSVPGLYHYYASKQEMLVAILDLTMGDLLDRSRAARAEGRGPAERFALMVECLALVHTHRRELAFVGTSEMRSLEPGSRERVAAARREQQRMVDLEVEAAARSGLFGTSQPREASRAVVTMCTALAQWFRDTGPHRPEQVAAQYVDLALDLVQCVAKERPRRHREALTSSTHDVAPSPY